MTNSIRMQTAISFMTDSLKNMVMLLTVIENNAVATCSPQVIDAYSAVAENIDWTIESLNRIKSFTERIPEIAASTKDARILKSYANVIREHYSTESICKFVSMYSETLNWDDEDYNEFGQLIDAISIINPNDGCRDLQAAISKICRYMINYYDRQKIETIGYGPSDPNQVSLSYLLDNLGYVFGNVDLDSIKLSNS